MSRTCFKFLIWLAASTYCLGHGGGLDGNGGHNGPGGYHFHSGGGGGSSGLFGAPDAGAIAAELEMERKAAFQAQQMVLGQRTAARDGARAIARTTAREQAKSASTSHPAKFNFHHAKQDPYIVADFTDNKDQWECLLAKGFKVNLKKDVIIRIEPIEDPTELRTWKDSTGEHSIVARYHAFTDPTVELVNMTSKLIKINVHILSNYDQQHLYNKVLHPDKSVTVK